MMHVLNLFLLGFGVLQGALISFFLFRKKRHHPSHIYLIIFLIVIGLQLTFKILSKAWVWYNVRLVYQFSYDLPFLIGPLLYLFFRSRRNAGSFNRFDLLHFIPFAISMLLTLLFHLYGYVLPIPYWKLFPWPSLELILLFVYGIASWKLLNTFEKENLRKGLKQLLVMVILAESLIVIAIVYSRSYYDMRLVFLTLTFLIYWVSYKLVSEPNVLIHIPEIITMPLKIKNGIKYANSGLKNEEADRIEKLLHHVVNTEKILLQSDMPIEAVATRLGVPRHHLSQVINKRFQKTYVEFINEWRLEEARSRLINPKFHRHTISTIALDSGFNSVSSFNTIFKRHFFLTPSQFRDQNLKK